MLFLQFFHNYTNASCVERWKSWSNLLSFTSVITIQIMGPRLPRAQNNQIYQHHTNEMIGDDDHCRPIKRT